MYPTAWIGIYNSELLDSTRTPFTFRKLFSTFRSKSAYSNIGETSAFKHCNKYRFWTKKLDL